LPIDERMGERKTKRRIGWKGQKEKRGKRPLVRPKRKVMFSVKKRGSCLWRKGNEKREA